MGLQAVIRRNEFGTCLPSAERREKLLWDAGGAALLLGGDVHTLPVKSPAVLVWLSLLSLPRCAEDSSSSCCKELQLSELP